MELKRAYCYCSQESKWLKFYDLGRSGYVDVLRRKFLQKRAELINVGEKPFEIEIITKRNKRPIGTISKVHSCCKKMSAKYVPCFLKLTADVNYG